jgi:short-subunit dehydrogenase
VKSKAVLIGNSDGIGLALSRLLLEAGWDVAGISRSPSPVEDPSYGHVMAQVESPKYLPALESLLAQVGPPNVCVYCAGMGAFLDPGDMQSEITVFEVNLLGMIKTASLVIPLMVRRGEGHFIGISSLADEMLSPDAPSYHASKAGFSNYLEGLALALKPRGIHVTNVRFGFVDTKLAKGDVKPFMMTPERAASHLLTCIRKKPIRYTAPWAAVPFVKLRSLVLRLRTL